MLHSKSGFHICQSFPNLRLGFKAVIMRCLLTVCRNLVSKSQDDGRMMNVSKEEQHTVSVVLRGVCASRCVLGVGQAHGNDVKASLLRREFQTHRRFRSLISSESTNQQSRLNRVKGRVVRKSCPGTCHAIIIWRFSTESESHCGEQKSRTFSPRVSWVWKK